MSPRSFVGDDLQPAQGCRWAKEDHHEWPEDARHGAIIRKLREPDRLLGEGAEVADVARHLEGAGAGWVCSPDLAPPGTVVLI